MPEWQPAADRADRAETTETTVVPEDRFVNAVMAQSSTPLWHEFRAHCRRACPQGPSKLRELMATDVARMFKETAFYANKPHVDHSFNHSSYHTSFRVGAVRQIIMEIMRQ
jgi:hypothetical protein